MFHNEKEFSLIRTEKPKGNCFLCQYFIFSFSVKINTKGAVFVLWCVMFLIIVHKEHYSYCIGSDMGKINDPYSYNPKHFCSQELQANLQLCGGIKKK